MAIEYVSTGQGIEQLIARLAESTERGEAVGLDTEFSGVALGTFSACTRAKLHVLSLAVKVFPYQLSPRGYQLSDAYVLRADDLWIVKPWLESEAPKAVHNLAVDVHSLQSVGVSLHGGINTLTMARFAWPERARGAGYTLDALGMDLLGTGKTETFGEIFQSEVTETRPVIKTRVVKSCACGEVGCKKRTPLDVHAKLCTTEESVKYITKVLKVGIPLESVLPGHELWPRLVNYAAQDAVLALGVYDLARAQMNKTRRYLPW